ncbi:MAG: hypothetical protein QXP53_02530, partial [Candidatus Pacearchaeota archaeon]
MGNLKNALSAFLTLAVMGGGLYYVYQRNKKPDINFFEIPEKKQAYEPEPSTGPMSQSIERGVERNVSEEKNLEYVEKELAGGRVKEIVKKKKKIEEQREIAREMNAKLLARLKERAAWSREEYTQKYGEDPITGERVSTGTQNQSQTENLEEIIFDDNWGYWEKQSWPALILKNKNVAIRVLSQRVEHYPYIFGNDTELAPYLVIRVEARALKGIAKFDFLNNLWISCGGVRRDIRSYRAIDLYQKLNGILPGT